MAHNHAAAWLLSGEKILVAFLYSTTLGKESGDEYKSKNPSKTEGGHYKMEKNPKIHIERHLEAKTTKRNTRFVGFQA